MGVSKKATADQARHKARFIKTNAQAADGVAVNDRILLDTGDGMSTVGERADVAAGP